mgnify:CR=1 FL=1
MAKISLFMVFQTNNPQPIAKKMAFSLDFCYTGLVIINKLTNQAYGRQANDQVGLHQLPS